MKNKNILIFWALLVSAILIAIFSSCSSLTITTNPVPATQTAPSTTSSPSSSPAPSTKPASTPIPTQAQPVELNVCAGASLTDVLKEINNLYHHGKPNVTITPNFAATGTLQTQIENGAPADVFISGAAVQMDNLQKKELLLNDTRKNLLNNKIVLIVPIDSTLGLTSFNDLATAKVKKVAIGDPKFVVAGTYAHQAFDELGITAQIQPKEVLGADVRQVLTYIETGNADAGIVFATDALTSKKVKVVAGAPADINAKVVYPVAVIKASKNPDAARDYLDFLFSTQAKAVFEKYGFTMVSK